MDPYAAILSNKTIGMAFESPKRHIFSFHTIQYIEIKYLLGKFFGRCADILTYHTVCRQSKTRSLHTYGVQKNPTIVNDKTAEKLLLAENFDLHTDSTKINRESFIRNGR